MRINYISGLEAVILDFPLPVMSQNIVASLIGLLVPENTDVAVGMSLLSCIQAEKLVHQLEFRF
jgi:hypothetical protein